MVESRTQHSPQAIRENGVPVEHHEFISKAKVHYLDYDWDLNDAPRNS